jgi:putative (di)nucleoside polyphosphate hydrolase
MIRKAIGAIIEHEDVFILVFKTKINTYEGKETIDGEWDFVKGGIEEGDLDLEKALFRELEEETGSTNYKIHKQYDEKICFDFPTHLKEKIGYKRQETTMFHVYYEGDINEIQPKDDEFSRCQFIPKQKVAAILTHADTQEFFLKHVVNEK